MEKLTVYSVEYLDSKDKAVLNCYGFYNTQDLAIERIKFLIELDKQHARTTGRRKSEGNYAIAVIPVADALDYQKMQQSMSALLIKSDFHPNLKETELAEQIKEFLVALRESFMHKGNKDFRPADPTAIDILTDGVVKYHVTPYKNPYADLQKEVIGYITPDHGWGNGYIRLDENHHLYGVYFDHSPIEVHGGFSYSQFELWNDKKVWVVGFDTLHPYDGPHLTKEKVIEMTHQLAEKVEAMSDMDTFLKKIIDNSAD